MHRYIKGAVFERKIIHDLIDMGALIAMRGAGSKSAGSHPQSAKGSCLGPMTGHAGA
jgi:Holliday junction resolvase